MTRGIARYQPIPPAKKTLARKLRAEMTAAERGLWSLIRRGQVNGRRFRRQQVIDGFVVDFYCPVLGLVIEVDGDVHAFQEGYDAAREDHLRRRGLRIVRFANHEIREETAAVMERLFELTKE